MSIWFVTYHTGANPPPGTATITTPAGQSYTFNFNSFCKRLNMPPTTQGVRDALLTTQDCLSNTAGGFAVLDANTQVMCYKKAPINLLGSAYTQVVVPEASLSASNTIWQNMYNAGNVDTYFAVPIDNVVPGWYSVSSTGTDYTLDPCSDQNLPCSLGTKGSGAWWFLISAHTTGNTCASQPTSTFTSGTDSTNSILNTWCDGVPNGAVCPITCTGGVQQLGLPICEDGVWSDGFKCASASCGLPTSSNNGGTANGNVYATGIEPNSAPPSCGVLSEVGAICSFSCSNSNYWGRGRVRCNSGGTWVAQDPETLCASSNDDVVPPPPVMTTMTQQGSTAHMVTWQAGTDNVQWRSTTIYYEFNVIPSGSLSCPTFNGASPPAGLACTGGNSAIIQDYQIQARAVNSKGPSAWSNLISSVCLAGPEIPSTSASRYSHSCPSKTDFGDTCDIACASPFLGNVATQVCSAAEQALVGPLPVCLTKANAPVNVGVTPLSTTSVHVEWDNAGLGSIGVEADPSGYTCTANTDCTGGSCEGGTCPITSIGTADLCAAECNNVATCELFVYDGIAQECHLKSGSTTQSATLPTARTKCCTKNPAQPAGGSVSFPLSQSNPFDSWIVEFRVGTGPWTSPTGCSGLFDKCETTCTASGLSPFTTYQVRVMANCVTYAPISSDFSLPGSGTTFPVAATAPTGLTVSSVAATTADLTWSAGTSNNCVFSSWTVQLQGSSSSFAPEPAGCQSLTSRGTVTCTLTSLPCSTPHVVKISETCTDPLANSPASSTESFTTLVSGSCVTPATAPVVSSFGREGSTHDLRFEWDAPANMNDCQFSNWRVQFSLDDGAWGDVFGCSGLTQFNVRFCVGQAFLVTSGQQTTGWAQGVYEAQVAVECQDSRANSPFSDSSSGVTPLPYASDDSFVAASSPTESTIVLNWNLPNFNDCQFQEYAVSLITLGAATATSPFAAFPQLTQTPADLAIAPVLVSPPATTAAGPTGCTNLVSPCTTTCTLTGLTSNTEYAATIQVICVNTEANMPLPLIQWPLSTDTLPIVQDAPLTVAAPVGTITASQGVLQWTTGQQSVDCVFAEWDVEFQEDGKTTWASATGCDSLSTFATQTCTFTSLSCDTSYRARVRQVCAISAATSPFRVSALFTMLKSGSCLRAASAPQFVTLAQATTKTIELTWAAGSANDCVFQAFQVQVQQVGSQSWQDIYAGSCQGQVTPRGGGGCTLQGLFSDTQYTARVRETCTDSAQDSGWSVSNTEATLEVPPIVLNTKLPSGSITQTRPTALTAIFDTNVRLNLPAIDPSTYDWAEKCANEGEPCTCVGTVYYGLRNAAGPGTAENTFLQMTALAGYKTVDNVNGVVGCRADCLQGSLPGLCVTGTNPVLPYACWCKAPTQPPPSKVSICPVTTAAEPNSCGCTGAACSTSCIEPQVGPTGTYLLNPQILWYTFGTTFAPATGCTYQVTIDEGYLKTLIEPALRSPPMQWNFVYSPAPPVLTLSLDTETPSSLTLDVSFNMPTVFTCQITGETSTASGLYVGPNPASITLDGLTPSRSYGVNCTANPNGDPWNIATPSAGPFTTSPDTNALLQDLQVTVATICVDNGPQVNPLVRPLSPAFQVTDTGGFYQVRIDMTNFRTECGHANNIDVLPTYVANITAVPQSQFATTSFSPAQNSVTVTVNWPASSTPAGTDARNISVTVQPFSGGPQAALTYQVEVIALFANLQFVSLTPSGELAAEAPLTTVDVQITVELGIDVSQMQLKFGTFDQTTTVASQTTGLVQGRTQQIVTLRVAAAAGYGSDLDVFVTAGGIEIQSPYQVSFEVLVILGRNNLPVCLLPTSTNDAGITGAAGHPDSIVATTGATPTCGDPHTESGAVCKFGCSVADTWSYGRLRCALPTTEAQGNWEKEIPQADCLPNAADSVWYPPTMDTLTDEGGGNMRVEFSWADDGTIRSEPSLFHFDVVPTGSLDCPDFVGLTPPAAGIVCTGGDANNMGQYSIKVLVRNLAGDSAWSNALQRACPAFTVAASADPSRYNVSACAALIDGQTCQVTCAAGTVQVGALPTFTCDDPPNPPSGSLPSCFVQANAPANVGVAGASPTSLTIDWEDGGLNDCGSLTPFTRWKVEVQTGAGSWMEPQGCLAVTSPCTTTCTATGGLVSNTAYSARVSAVCQAPEVSSDASAPGSGSTFPSVALPPVTPTLDSTGTSNLSISWSPNGEQGDCVFQEWLVELQGPSGTWSSNPDGCENLNNAAVTACALQGLTCETNYQFRVRQICTDSLADSAPSAPGAGTTLRDGSCLDPAGTPTNVAGVANDPNSITLTWTPGTPNDCTFTSWRVRVRRTFNGVSGGWIANSGCSNLNTRVSTCTAGGLEGGKTYHFYIVEECQDPQTNSQASQTSPAVTTPYMPAEAPTNVVTSAPGVNDFTISWDSEDLNDCTFHSWNVSILEMGSTTWVTPSGCSALINPCITSCMATGLTSDTTYIARVSVECLQPTADSPISTPSPPILTEPIETTPPTGFASSNPGETTADFAWTPSTPSIDCSFVEWEVEVRPAGSAQWSAPSGCDSLTTRATATCSATGLLCDTSYDARMREVCQLSGATSDYVFATSFATLKLGSCLRGATAPGFIRATNPTTTTLSITFVAGSPNDCVFQTFDVEKQQVGTSTWAAVGGDCTGMSARTGPSCTATGLPDGAAFLFRARERCSNGDPAGSLDSPWGTSTGSGVSTIAVPPVTVVARIPEGTLTETRPNSLLVVFGVNVELDQSAIAGGARLRLCPETSLTVANSCGCTAATCANACIEPTSGYFINPQVFLYSFGQDLVPGSNCRYNVTIDPGYIQTVMTPAKSSPIYSWAFTFAPPPPQLTLSVPAGGSTISSITFSVSYSVNTRFNISVLGSPNLYAAGVYTGTPVQVTIAGLQPSTNYMVDVLGTVASDQWNSASVLRGPFRTLDDTNADLSTLTVGLQQLCTENGTPGPVFMRPLVPPFDADVANSDHIVRIDVTSFRSDCNIPDNQEATIRYIATLNAGADSPFASLVFTPGGGTGTLELDWPANTPTPVGQADVNLSVAILPFTGGSALQNVYDVQVIGLFANLQIVALRAPTLLAGEAPLSQVEMDITLELGISTGGMFLSFGDFSQSTTVSSTSTGLVQGRMQQLVTLQVAAAVGYGSDLDVKLFASGIEYSTIYQVSFQPLVILDSNGLPICELPDSTNNAGINTIGGHPNDVWVTSEARNCNVSSMSGAVCRFDCSAQGGWGFGRIVCGLPLPNVRQGNWQKNNPAAACYLPQNDSVWYPPVITALDDEGQGNMRVWFDWDNDGTIRSEPLNFQFDVTPTGSLVCPDIDDVTAPTGGAVCTGGDPNNMGQYMIKVRVENLAGRSAWSNVMQRACPAFVVPSVQDQWRYDVSACATLIDGQTCQVTCTGGTVQVGELNDFLCDPPQTPQGTLPNCYLQANAPTNVAAQGVADDSLSVTWVDAGLNDCGGAVAFNRWKVEFSTDGESWVEFPGCLQNTNPCTTTCTATGLDSNTQYSVRVSTVCGVVDVNSPDSNPGSGSTWPTVAQDPQGGSVENSYTTSLDISWVPSGDQGDCIFEEWLVEVQGPSGTWTSFPEGCDTLNDFNTASCTLTGLTCETNYQFRVVQGCTDPRANSVASTPAAGQTLRDGSCLDPAGTPTQLAGVPLDPETAVFTWTPGAPGDCTFQSWRVRIRRTYNGISGGWITNPGCLSLTTRNPTCTATGLEGGKTYNFYVVEECRDSQTNSQISQVSPDIVPPLRPAEPPDNVLTSDPDVFSFKITWDAGDMNDCIFSGWLVEIAVATSQGDGRRLVESWSTPQGCDTLADPCTTECTPNVLSNTMYQARVKVECQDSDADSTYSATSNPTLTLPIPTDPPTNLGSNNPGETQVDLSWQAPTPSIDCEFSFWEVALLPDGSSTWITPDGCDELTTRTPVSCTATGLQCDTGYITRVREVCVLSGATSTFTQGASFDTLKLGTCLRGATAPEFVRAANPTTTTLSLTFTAGSPNDCFFRGFDVQKKEEGTNTWVSVGGDCNTIPSREGPSCTAEGLPDGTSWFFRARERCLNGANLDSPWGTSEEGVSTIAVPPVTIVAEVPLGTLTETRPNSVLVVFAVNVVLDQDNINAGTAQMRICPSTNLTVPNSCGCVASTCANSCVVANGAYLINPQVLFYGFGNTLRPGSFCDYTVELDPGFIKTEMTPAKSSPLFTWDFIFTPPPPTLNMFLVSSTIDSLTISVEWSVVARFNASIVSGAQSWVLGDYAGNAPAIVTITGLLPSSQYEVDCNGTAIDDIWNSAVERRGVWGTLDDTNANFSDLKVALQRQCTDTAEPGPVVYGVLDPPFTNAGVDSVVVRIDVTSFRDQCNIPSEQDATIRYIATIEATPDSPYAILDTTPSSGTQTLELDWPRNTDRPVGFVDADFTVSVLPYTGRQANAKTVNVEVVALFANLQVQTLRAPSLLAGEAPLSRVEVDITLEKGINTDNINVKIGDFIQSTSVINPIDVTIGGRLQQQVTLVVPAATGYGPDLDLKVVAGGIEYPADDPADLQVSFEQLVILDDNGLPVCFAPDATNNAGIDSETAGHPNFIVTSAIITPGCGMPYTDSGSSCKFMCSGGSGGANNAWGFGRLRCGAPLPGEKQGQWIKEESSADCYPESADSGWYPPVLNALDDEGNGEMLVHFWWENDGTVRSEPTHFEFDVVPAGTLVCPDFIGNSAPPEGHVCTGGNPNNMGQYIIKVRPVNLDGSGQWSNAMQRACPALEVAMASEEWRYIVDDCADLIDRETCQVRCTPATVKVGELPVFTCGPPDQPTGTWPQCYQKAQAPANIDVTGTSDDSVRINWQDGGLGDCGGRVRFIRWKVEARRNGTTAWFEPDGCAVTNKCDTTCEAVSLQSNTEYDVRVSAECEFPEVNSPLSNPGSGSTYPTVSQPPQSLSVDIEGTTTLAVSWQVNSDEGDCVFQEWAVELRGPSGTWRNNPDGCQNLQTQSQASCVLLGLTCETEYEFRVSQICTDPRANSVTSDSEGGATIKDGSCLVPAGMPTDLAGVPLNPNEVDLSWTPGEPGDCTFQSWRVYIRRTYNGVVGAWVTNPGCSNIVSRVTGCRATGLIRGTYHFYVQEECRDSQTNSPISPTSDPIIPPLTPAEPPTDATLSEPTIFGFKIEWESGRPNDCTFRLWQVQVQIEGGDTWTTPSGCDALINECLTECVANSVTSNSVYTSRVKMLCQEDEAVSPFSEISNSILTLPQVAPVPTDLTASSPTVESVDLSWTAATPSIDCDFLEWEVAVLIDTYSTWSRPDGCDALLTRSTTGCTATGLQCDQGYTVRVREVCALPLATGPYVRGAAFRTTKEGVCLRGATPPQFLRAGDATTTSLTLTFTAGTPNDCVFAGFDVQYLQVGSSPPWLPATGTCADIPARAGPSCTATDLLDGVSYNFRAREKCSNGDNLNSPWGTTEESATTIAVPPVTLVAIIPEGVITQNRPETLLIVYEVNVVLNMDAISPAAETQPETQPETRRLGDAGARVRVCPTTTLEVPNSCGCFKDNCSEACIVPGISNEEGDVGLLNPQVLMWKFGGGFVPGSHCNYTVEVDTSFVKTEITPSKMSPFLTWDFRFSPPPPVLELFLSTHTITSVTLSVEWNKLVNFECWIVSVPTTRATGQFTDNGPVLITLGDPDPTLSELVPSAPYDVDCRGVETEDQWNGALERRGVFRTMDDTNAFFEEIKVWMQMKCSDEADPLEAFEPFLTPPFDYSRKDTSHVARVDVSAFRRACNIPLTEPARVLYRTFLNSSAQSIFATVVQEPAEAWLELLWPAGERKPDGQTSAQLSTTVLPYTGGSALANRIDVEVIALFANPKILVVTPDPEVLPVNGQGACTIVMTTKVGTPMSDVVFKFGYYFQLANITGFRSNITDPEDPESRVDETTFAIFQPVGVGRLLNVSVLIQGLEFFSGFQVNFQGPIVTTIRAIQLGGQPQAKASMLAPTELLVSGQNLALPQDRADGAAGPALEVYVIGVPEDCVTKACVNRSVFEGYFLNNTPNLCGPTQQRYRGNNIPIFCGMEPNNANPLGIGVFAPDGQTGAYLVDVGDPEDDNQAIRYGPPEPQEMTNPKQDLNGDTPFAIQGPDGGWPSSNITGGFLQFWATNFDRPPTDPNNPGPGYVPLCKRVITNGSDLVCDRFDNWNAGELGSTSPRVFIQFGPTLYSETMLERALTIPPVLFTEEERTDDWEVGPTNFTIRGENFGTIENGEIVVDFQTSGNDTISQQDSRRLQLSSEDQRNTTANCKILERNTTSVTCLLEGSIFGAVLPDADYDKEFTDPDRNHTYPVQATVKYKGVSEDGPLAPGAQPLLAKESFTVRLFRCEKGNYRSTREAKECLPCDLGHHKNTSGTGLYCFECQAGRYADEMGQADCKLCAPGFTTRMPGATTDKLCKCMPGYFKDLTTDIAVVPGPHGTGTCLPCPENAICEGFDAQPYSQAGYWSLDERRFWACYPKEACLQGNINVTNICQEGRKDHGRRCVECLTGWYRYRSRCHQCKTIDRVIAWVAPLLILWFIIFVVVPNSVKQFHKARTQQKRHFHTVREEGWLFRIQPAHKWPHAFKVLAAPGTPVLRLIVLAFNRLQLVWALGLLPREWSTGFEDQLTFLGLFAFDYDILRPECMRDPARGFAHFIELSYTTRWFLQWATPYVICLLLVGGLAFNCIRHRNPDDRRYIHFQSAVLATVSIQALFQLMSHTVDNLYFIRCMSCEDDDLCMVDFPLYKCDFSRLGENHPLLDMDWTAIAIVSFFDLVLVTLPLFSVIAWAIYRSWCWQHGEGSGITEGGHMPWFLAVSEFWVMYYRGYSKVLRDEAIVLRDMMRKLVKGNVDLHEVWDSCVHQTNYERWLHVGHTLQHHVDSVVKFIEVQRRHGVRGLLKLDKEGADMNLSDDELRQIRGVIAAKSSRLQRAKERRAEYTLGLEEQLKKTQTFIKEVEGGTAITPSSLFWTYSWEVTLLAQKLFVVLIAMSASPDSDAVVLAGCFFFMLIVLIMEVKMEPHEWDFLNHIEVIMNVLTLYLIVFAQLNWITLVFICALVINVVTLGPVLLRWILPTFPEQKKLTIGDRIMAEEEEDGEVDELAHEGHRSSSQETVQLAMMEAALGLKGTVTFNRMQEIMKWKARQNIEARAGEHIDGEVDVSSMQFYNI